MKLQVLLIIGFALSATGCENKEQAEPEQAAEATTTAPVAESMTTDKESYQYDGILRHMHAHADQIDLLNNALANGDLDASKLPARWLWRHDTLDGVPADWQQYLTGMREAARDAESATDLETARAASIRITEQCQACHTAVGIVTNGVEPEGD